MLLPGREFLQMLFTRSFRSIYKELFNFIGFSRRYTSQAINMIEIPHNMILFFAENIHIVINYFHLLHFSYLTVAIFMQLTL